MIARSSRLTPERLGAFSVGLAAAMTSTLLSGWASLSLFGRGLVFFGSLVSGLFLVRWTMRASSTRAAFGRSVLAGAVQSNVAASALIVLAMAADTIFETAPTENHFGDAFAFMFVMLIFGSFVGLAIGALYGFVPAYVVASRDERSHATLDRVIVANGAWLSFIGFGHLTVIALLHGRSSTRFDPGLAVASWLVPLVLAVAFIGAGIVRAKRRSSFIACVRAGFVPGYRIVPIEAIDTRALLPVDNRSPRGLCHSVLVRVAAGRDAERSYRTNALPIDDEPLALVG